MPSTEHSRGGVDATKHDSLANLPISGDRAELVDRFMVLLDGESDGDPRWWRDVGSQILLNFSGTHARDADPSISMKSLRNAIEHATSAGMAEDALVRGLKQQLDDVMRRRSDADGWQRGSADLLPDSAFDRWHRLDAIGRQDANDSDTSAH